MGGSTSDWSPTDVALTVGTGGLYGAAKMAGIGGAPQKVKGAGLGFSQNALQAENDVIARQQAIASGQTPSISAMQYQQALDQSNKAGQSMAASARGVNPALAYRAALLASQEANAGAANQAGVMGHKKDSRQTSN